MPKVRAQYFTDPGCPWGYSWRPAHARLRWRFGDQIEWRHTMIGLSETTADNDRKGLTPAKYAGAMRDFRDRFGMPFALTVRPRVPGTALACRAVVAVREMSGDENLTDATLRALQLMNFNTERLIDQVADVEWALDHVAGLDPQAVLERLDSPGVAEAYRRDHEAARSAESRPSEVQGRHAEADGIPRYTAPTVVFENPGNGQSAEIGGFQRFETYDTALANIAPELERRPVPEDPYEVLAAFPHGLTSAEVASVMRPSELAEDDRAGVEQRLIDLVGEGRIETVPLGSDALWRVTLEPGEERNASPTAAQLALTRAT